MLRTSRLKTNSFMLILFPMMLLISGCTTTTTNITTAPPGATVDVEGYGTCETPCSVQIDRSRNITIAKAGFKKQELILSPGRRNLKLDLELAAPTSNIDAGDLPPLN